MTEDEILDEYDALIALPYSKEYSEEAKKLAAQMFAKVLPILEKKRPDLAEIVLRHYKIYVEGMAHYYETKLRNEKC